MDSSTHMDLCETQLLDDWLEFDFDFPGDTVSCASNETSDCSTGKRRGRGVAKSSKSKGGAKCKNTLISKKKQLEAELPIPVEEIQIEYYTKPIYAFPSFDKSDALIYMTSTLTRYMNSGDVQSASKLLLSHLDKNCVIDMPHHPSGFFNTKSLVNLLNTTVDIHPDSIMCVHRTKVDANKIWSSIYMKFTDSRAIRDSVRTFIGDPTVLAVIDTSREEQVQKCLADGDRSEEELAHFRTIATTKEDILIYLSAEVEMTVNEVTKKVSQFSIKSRTTSMHLAPQPLQRLD